MSKFVKKLVSFEWVDACLLGNDSLPHKEAREYGLIHGLVCGWLIQEDKETITLARDWFDEVNTYRGGCVYPKKLITNRFPDKEIRLEENI